MIVSLLAVVQVTWNNSNLSADCPEIEDVRIRFNVQGPPPSGSFQMSFDFFFIHWIGLDWIGSIYTDHFQTVV